MALSALYVLRGKQGIQGPIGPSGDEPASFVSYIIFTPVAVTVSETVTISASLPINGVLNFIGQLAIEASANSDLTITPRVGGSSLTTMQAKTTMTASKFASVPIVGQLSVTAGQPFSLIVAFSSGNGSINSGAILYSIQE